jgi:hypothetical protein
MFLIRSHEMAGDSKQLIAYIYTIYIYIYPFFRKTQFNSGDSTICITTSNIMLLLIIVSLILVSADAIPNYSINQIDKKLNYLVDEVSNIPAVGNPQLFAPIPPDAKLTTVSKTVNVFQLSNLCMIKDKS